MLEQTHDIVFVVELILSPDELNVTKRIFALDHKVFGTYAVGGRVIKHTVTNDTITDDRMVTCLINMALTPTVCTVNKFSTRC
jgi:hypothetical protein